jgi:ferredoxin-NADP reductase
MGIPQKLCCQVAAIKDHGERVYTVDLLPERPAPRFRPGQFLHLALDRYDPSSFWPESRVFSIASSPSQRERLRISYSVKGRFTTGMERELHVGGQVWVKLPYGDFVIRGERNVVLFAGGTGITAFTAFLEGLTSTFSSQVMLFYGVRRPELFLYQDMIAARVAAVPRLTVHYFVEQGARGNHLSGRLSAEAALPLIQEPLDASYYLSGPPLMLRTLRGQLKQQGVLAEAISVDAWE